MLVKQMLSYLTKIAVTSKIEIIILSVHQEITRCSVREISNNLLLIWAAVCKDTKVISLCTLQMKVSEAGSTVRLRAIINL